MKHPQESFRKGRSTEIWLINAAQSGSDGNIFLRRPCAKMISALWGSLGGV